VSFGLVDNAPAIRGSPRQQLDDLNDQKPGRERIKKRLSLLSAEREASRLWKESLAAGRPEQGQQSSEYENVLRIHVEESGIKEQEDVDSYSGGPASGDSIGAAREGPQRSEERGTRSEKEKALEALRRAGALEKLHIDIDGNWSGGAAPSEATDVVAALVAEQRKRRQIEAFLEQAAAEQDDLAVEVIPSFCVGYPVGRWRGGFLLSNQRAALCLPLLPLGRGDLCQYHREFVCCFDRISSHGRCLDSTQRWMIPKPC